MRAASWSWLLALAACTSGGDAPPDASTAAADAARVSDVADAAADAGALGAIDAAPPDSGHPDSASAPPPDSGAAPTPCTTRITYGSAWIHGPDHPAQHDDAGGLVTWDGACHADGNNSYAELSHGWRPYFAGRSSCVIALDARGDCPAVPATCTTRITYGATWLAAPDHPAQHDDVAAAVSWDGECAPQSGGRSSATLSNGWTPFFTGTDGCALSLRYESCGGLFANPVVDADCPDPGVVHDGTRYVMACTGGDFALRTSTDLVRWQRAGAIFAPGRRPSWASGDFWAPEIHRVGDRWVAYFSARNAADGALSLGAATGPTAVGPFTDIGRPLLHDPSPGVIDVHRFVAPDGAAYLLWKVDGNAVRAPTPIYIQPLAADGVTLTGTRTRLITNDQRWEGALVEGPWMIHEGGTYYLLYSANGYASPQYAVGVARASSPLGPFTKLGAPILRSNGAFGGPGHGSIVRGPSGAWVHVYHAWIRGQEGGGPGRLVLVDRIGWEGGWPRMLSAPSPRSQPVP